uniref:Carn_acyltransf domain-containing protein n=1 Tax=Rhabditophanes sp. KR3021 TaxID=114890 RepID=A0AC35TWF4_9BILA
MGNKQSTDKKGSKKVAMPHKGHYTYPNVLTRTYYRSYNNIHNKMYPIHPVVFTSATLSLHYYLMKHGADFFKTKLTILNEVPYISQLKFFVTSLTLTSTSVFLLRKLLKHTYYSYKQFLFEPPKQASLKTKAWGLVNYLLTFYKPKFNDCDKLLPNLPVPHLETTCTEYLDSIKPVVSELEYYQAKAMVMEFLLKEGPRIQKYCHLYSFFVDNYVTSFWEQYAYLYSREPLLINSSVAYADIQGHIPCNQARRAAHGLHHEAKSMLALDRQDLEAMGSGLLCMNHYHKNFCTVRVPGETLDHIVKYEMTKHVIIIHQGLFYKVDLFEENGEVKAIEDLYEIMVDILLQKVEDATEFERNVAAFTTDRRDTWCKNRKKFFLDNEVNGRNLKLIESAIMIMSLDDMEDIKNDHETTERMLLKNLTGAGNDKWVDKTMNAATFKNGRFGGTLEHSVEDASEYNHLFENYVAIDLFNTKYPSEVEDIYARKEKRGLHRVERIKFDITKEMEPEIDRCMNYHVKAAANVDLKCLFFEDWGKGLIKKCLISPNGFLQMAIQLAYFKDQGQFTLTYEAASTRFFQNARTETLRTVSEESCAFVRAMMDETVTKETKINLLRVATEKHTLKNKQCMVGNGLDRHLFVLYVLSQGLSINSPFLNYYISKKWPLSTSQPPKMTSLYNEDKDPGTIWNAGCFGAVDKEGYGVIYRFEGNGKIMIHVTSYKDCEKTDSQRFKCLIEESIKEMIKIFEN